MAIDFKLDFQPDQLDFQLDFQADSTPTSGVDAIPGVMPQQPKVKPTDGQVFFDSLMGIPDAAAGVMSGLIKGVQDPITAGVKRLTGQVDDFEEEANRLARQGGYEPKTKFGKKITKEVVTPAFEQLLGPMGAMILGPAAGRSVKNKIGEDAKVLDEYNKGQQTVSDIVAAEKAAQEAPKQIDFVPEQMELPLETTAQQIAERRGAEVGQRDLFGPTNEPMPKVIPEAEFPAVPSATDVSIAKTQDLNRRGQQMAIVEDFGNNDPMARMPEMRVDENGIPIRADLSMEARNLENPLQRNLWGDELGPALDQVRSLTEAIDTLPKGAERDAALSQFHPPKGQLGAINLEDVMSSLDDLKRAIPRNQRGALDFGTGKYIFDSPEMLDKLKRIGIHINPIEEYPWSIRSREIAEREVKAKYLTEKDVRDASRIFDETGDKGKAQEHLINVLDQRSNYKWVDEVQQRRKALPAEMDYAKEHFGFPSSNEIAKARRDNFQVHTTEKIPVGEVTEFFDGVRPRPHLMVVPKNERGAIDLGPKTPKKDTLKEPRSPEKIAEKAEIRKKLELLKRENPEYYRVTTLEEANAMAQDVTINDIKDSAVRNATVAGINGMVNLHPKNPYLNYARTVLQDARNKVDRLSQEFVTGENGIVAQYRALKKEDMVRAAEVLIEAGHQKTLLTDALMDKLGLNASQKAFMNRFRQIMDQFYFMANEANLELGYGAFEYRPGYVPGMFTGGYKTLRGHYKNGRFIPTGMAQADTRYGLQAANDFYDSKGADYAVTVTIPRSKLADTPNFRATAFDSFNEVINAIAANDPEFARAKQLADGKVREKIKHLYGFDVHELNKKGIKGSLGDKPWLSREANSKEFIEGVIQFIEQGLKYYGYQGAFNKIGELNHDPSVRARFPNTLKYINEHVAHVAGRNLSGVGGGLNWVIDQVPKLLGASYKVPSKVMHETKNIMSIYMMGTYNPAFFAAQLTQLVTGAMPEAIKLSGALDGQSISKAFSTSYANFGLMQLENMGVFKKAPVPDHVRQDYEWARDHGLFSFNELEMAHEAMKNKTVLRTEQALALPMSAGEKLTRPQVFMAYARMLYDFGITTPDRFEMAQNATNFAMADYHADERPHLYSSLGVTGHYAGALTTYKHNRINQDIVRLKDANPFGRANFKPLLFSSAVLFALIGVGGMAGYNELDEVVKFLTRQAGDEKNIRQMVLDHPKQPSKIMDGWASAATDIDFQSRLSLANILPEAGVSAISPQASALVDILSKLYTAGKYQTKQAVDELLYATTPSGMKGFAEEAMRKNEEGRVLDKRGRPVMGQNDPRTPEEWERRKWLGFRPLRERLTREDNYTQSQAKVHKDEKLTKLQEQMYNAAVGVVNAYKSKDMKAHAQSRADLKRMFEDYRKLGGNPEYDMQGLLDRAAKDSELSEEQRLRGIPSNNINSINRYKHYD